MIITSLVRCAVICSILLLRIGARGELSTNLTRGELVIVVSDGAVVRNNLTPQVSALIVSRDFAALEKIAEDLRTSKARTAAGTWQLFLFYSILADLAETATDADWKTRREFLKEWNGKRPESITARVALADYY